MAAALNGQPVGGKRRSFHAEDLWTMKYLPKFKWGHLTERISYENAVRQRRLQAEDAQVRREAGIYLAQVSKAKADAAMAKRRGGKKVARKVRMRQPLE